MDFGISKSLWDGRGSLRFNITDIFYTNQFKVDVQQGTLDVQLIGREESRRAGLFLRYNFGSQEVKSARRRQTATEAEQNRADN